METCYFREPKEGGMLSVSGLPCYKENDVEDSEFLDWQKELDRWLADIRSRHPFASMNKNDILRELRKTREMVSSES
jgi:hypothetical protein